MNYKRFLPVAALVAILATGNAFAQSAFQQVVDQTEQDGDTGDTGLPEDNSGNSLGCQVLLCLASPGGPTEFAECVPPIKELYKRLAKGKSFPKCAMAGGGDNANYAEAKGDFIRTYVDGQLVSVINWRTGEPATGTGGGSGGTTKPTDTVQQER